MEAVTIPDNSLVVAKVNHEVSIGPERRVAKSTLYDHSGEVNIRCWGVNDKLVLHNCEGVCLVLESVVSNVSVRQRVDVNSQGHLLKSAWAELLIHRN